jgi:hypothetical protein
MHKTLHKLFCLGRMAINLKSASRLWVAVFLGGAIAVMAQSAGAGASANPPRSMTASVPAAGIS